MEQIRFPQLNRVISADWTIKMEEDIRAGFDEWITITRRKRISPRQAGPCVGWVNTYRVKNTFQKTIQSEMINIIGEQIALDIDNQIISNLMNFTR